MGKNNWSSGFRQKKGQSLVEFAAGITGLLIILAGVVDVGRLLATYITYRDAAEEGASFGSLYPTYCNQIQDRALSILGYPSGIQANVKIDSTACLSATSAQACLGHTISVEVKDPNFDITMPFLGAIIGTNHFPLAAVVNNTIIRTPCH